MRYVMLKYIIGVIAGMFSLIGCVHNRPQPPLPKPPLEINVRFAVPTKPKPRPEPSTKQLSDDEIIQRFWYWYNLLEIKSPQASADKKSTIRIASRGFDDDGTTNCIVQYLFSNAVDDCVIMTINAETGALSGLTNFAVLHKLSRFDVPDDIKPTKTQEMIQEEAKRYSKLIIGDLTQNFRMDEPKFITTGPNIDYRGYWETNCPRMLNGYEFVNIERLHLRIHENYGLIDFVCFMDWVPCPTEVKITEVQAKEIALATLPIVIARNPGLPKKVKDRKLTCKLCIISPNYIFCPGGPIYKNRHTRLAYHINFEVNGEWTEGKIKDEIYTYPLHIDVDAATGEILGGDYPK